jgi:hypothetical protein
MPGTNLTLKLSAILCLELKRSSAAAVFKIIMMLILVIVTIQIKYLML